LRTWIGRGLGPFHLEIDTGMGRTGLRWDEVDACAALLTSPLVEGAFTQFHSSEQPDGSAERQLERFHNAIARLPRRPGLLHTANSAAALRDRRFACDMVRPGVFLYGGSPGGGLAEGQAVVALRARVVSVRAVRAGESVSYNASWTAGRDTVVATLSIGYADGLPRLLGAGGQAYALLNGARCPYVGLVTMDLTMIEAGATPVAVGDVATLIGVGGSERVTLEQLAQWGGVLQREFLTGLGSRLPRVYA
jgi:alanine racemase